MKMLLLLICALQSVVIADEFITIPIENEISKVNSNSVSVLETGNRVVWIGTESGNLFYLQKNGNAWLTKKAAFIKNDKINCLFWADTILFIGTDKYVYSFKPHEKAAEPVLLDNKIETTSPVIGIYKYKNNIWFVTKKNICKVEAFEKGQIQEHQFTKNNKVNIHSVFPAFDKCYFETDNGLLIIPSDSEKIERISKSTALNGVRLITGSYKEDEMWFGTSYGLFSYNSSDSLWNRNEIDKELPDIVILSSEWYGQFLWLGTMRGPACFNVNSNQMVPVSLPDSLKDMPINAIATIDNNVVLAISAKGLLIKEIRDVPYVCLNKLELKKDSVLIHGVLFGEKIKSCNFFFSPNISPVLNLTDGLTLQKNTGKSDIICIWDTKDLNDGDYIFGARIEDESGKTNVTQASLSNKHNKIEIILDPFPEYVKTKTLQIKKHYL